jgi:hypothetical protein
VRTVTDRRSTGPLLAFVSSNRATAQIVVSINSAILAGLNVYTATKLLNFATRIHLLGQSLTLTMLKFINAVSTRCLVSGVPAAMCTTSVVMVAHLLSYNYTKPGYLTTVTCFHNASSNWHLEEIQPGKPDNGIPYIYYAIGYFPNAVPGAAVDFFSVVGLNGKANIAVLAAKHAEGRNIILITAGSDYPVLNKLIDVHPITTTTSAAAAVAPSFDPTAGIASTLISQVNYLGMISTSLYTSIVGDSLMSNIAAATAATSSSSPFAAMADSFVAMADDILLFIGSSQFFVPAAGAGDFSTTDAHLNVLAVRLGDTRYVLATFAMCVVLLMAVGAEAVRTGAWRQLPKWDFTDTTCLVLASAAAGEDVVAGMWRSGGAKWTGGGSWEKEKGSNALKGWCSGGVLIRLRLGRKVVKVAQQARDGDEKAAEEVRISAVSLWTSDAAGIVPLE